MRLNCRIRCCLGLIAGIIFAVVVLVPIRRHGPFGGGIERVRIVDGDKAADVDIQIGETYWFSWCGREFCGVMFRRKVITTGEYDR